VDATRRTGWSVTVVGEVRAARDAVEHERLASLPLQPWVAGDRSILVVVEVGMVNGRRIGGPAVLQAQAWRRTGWTSEWRWGRWLRHRLPVEDA
jgi:hypothetical protein